MANKSTTIRLSQNNLHLLDLFTDYHYLELGNINYQVMEQLLAYQKVDASTIIDKPLQSRSIGSSHLHNPILQEKLPFFHFININRKNPSLQLFLTFGLAVGKDKEHHPLFAPIILIPVIFDRVDDKFQLTMMASPIENKLLLDHMHATTHVVNQSDKLDSLYDMDNYCIHLTNMGGMQLSIENYLTFAEVEQPQIVINHELFSLKNRFFPLHSRYYQKGDNKIYFVTPLNNKQRLAVQRASTGNSFALSGAFDTGKTTTLINIAADALMQNKKVCYISNVSETLDLVHEFFVQKGLDFLVTNLSHSYVDPVYAIPELRKETIDIGLAKGELTEAYDTIESYQNLWNQRILHFRFVEVVQNILKAKNAESEVDIDNVDDIYKNEYEEIIYSLRMIENDMQKIPRFKSSKFIHIPINHNIKYPNQVITLLFEMHQLFTQLHENKEVLEKQYGFNAIFNYARLKNIIGNFNALDISKVPPSWMKDTQYFHKAFTAFTELKNDIYHMHEQELYLNWDFTNHQGLDIDRFITDILHDYFLRKEKEKINAVLEKHIEMTVRLRIANHQARVFKKNLEAIKTMLHWPFDENNVHILAEIVRLTEYINENIVCATWFNQKKAPSMRQNIIKTSDKLRQLYALKETYGKVIQKHTLGKIMISLVAKQQKAFICRYFKHQPYDVLLSELTTLKDLLSQEEKLLKSFQTLTGVSFQLNDRILRDFDQCQAYLSHFTHDEYRQKMVAFLVDMDYANLADYLLPLNAFKKAYLIVTSSIEYIHRFIPYEKNQPLLAQMTTLEEAYDYVVMVGKHNQAMRRVVKTDRDIIPIDTYFLLQDRIKELKRIKSRIHRNKEYPYLFGDLFQKESSNVNEIGLTLKNFQLYTDCFSSDETLVASLNQERYQQIKAIITKSLSKVNDLHHEFALYNKFFKDGIGGYYYDAFDLIIAQIKERLEAKDELLTYLNMTDHLKILSKYKCYVMMNLIINNEVSQLVHLFHTRYFTRLYERFVTQFPILKETSSIEDALAKSYQLENALANYHLQLLQEKRQPRTSNLVGLKDKHKQNDVNPLCLMRTQTLDNMIDIHAFDIVLIDDAHFLHANHYHKAILGKQVIIAGEKNIHPFSSSNLMLRMRASNRMRLSFCYTPTPTALASTGLAIHHFFMPRVKDNDALLVKKGDVVNYILQLATDNPTIKINLFTSSLEKKIKMTEAIAKQRLHNQVAMRDILMFLEKQLNIVDIFSGQVIQADKNILLLEDYYHYDHEFIQLQSLTHLLLSCKQLVVFDNQDILKQNITTRFASIVQELVSQERLPFGDTISIALHRMKEYLVRLGFEYCGSHYEMNLVMKKVNTYYGFILMIDPIVPHMDILETYRQYQVFKKHKLHVKMVWLIDMMYAFKETMEQILGDLNE